jgi:serine/threonine protein kinase
MQSLHALRNRELYGVAPGSLEESHILQEFVAEVVMIAALGHKNIVSFRGVCLERATAHPKYVVMELADSNLQEYLDSLTRGVTVDEALGFCEEVLSGLAYLHSLAPPVMHRDLKPTNILVFLSRVAGSVVLKIGDVGLARLVAGSTASHRATHGVGTLFYMAPEVLSGRYDHMADMYSFAVMLAEVVVDHAHISDGSDQ